MENLTIVGMKELNQKLSRIDRSLEDIAKSLSTLVKIANRQFPRAQLERKGELDVVPFPDEEDDDDMR